MNFQISLSGLLKAAAEDIIDPSLCHGDRPGYNISWSRIHTCSVAVASRVIISPVEAGHCSWQGM